MSSSPNSADAKPYKGPESYQVEDADIFFGREDETNQIIAKILASRFTLLHAQSGAGKTSLLNARLIPGLEVRGWHAYRVLPQNDPIESIRATTLQYVVPSPAAEVLAIERALSSLAPDKTDLTIKELLQLYDQLEIKNPLRRTLVKKVSGFDPSIGPSAKLHSADAYFGRLLRSTIEIEAFGEHIAAVRQAAHSTSEARVEIYEDTKLSELVALLKDDEFLSSYNKLLNELNVPGRDLSVFFEHLVETYGRRRSRFGLVLLLDQFEEVFTRFVDLGVTASDYVGELPDWRLRWELFDQLDRLCANEPAFSEPKADGNGLQTLPIRYVISMRDEYIAQMDPIRRFASRLNDTAYHLNLLEKKQARLAIQQPAEIFGYTYAPECFEAIIKQLTKEDRFVEPAHLQLVCDKLWNEKGHELAAATPDDESNGDSLLIQKEVFESLGETKGILKSFLTDFLQKLDNDSGLEVLEILEPLVTTSGTRNIIERDRLINVPLRDAQKRAELLNLLVNNTIVRTEARLGGYFVEITHEFLIAPILEAIRDAVSKDPDYNRYRLALRTMERLYGSSLVATTAPLSQVDFWTLDRHQNAVRWDRWATEAMLRCSIAYGVSRDILKNWLHRFDEFFPETGPSSIDEAIKQALHQGDRELLSLGELRQVNSDKDRSANLPIKEIELIWRSQLTFAVDADRDEVRYWTERMKNHG
jgi:hypothetical protein